MLDLRDALGAALAGRYEIERELGQGGMATVFLARDLKHRRHVAVKVLRPELAASIGGERFAREIEIAAGLSHPNILALHDSGEAQGLLYYVMPYVSGPTLRQRLERERQLPIPDAIEIAKQVAAALDYAHERGIVHRDIKPENILLPGEHVLVADFGLARAIHTASSAPLSRSGLAVGTPGYISPEQASADRPVDARADIYSLACVVFEMIAGVPPFRGATVHALLAHHASTAPPSLRTDRPGCPAAIDDAVRKGMAKVPADRFRTAGDFARALQAASGVRPDRGAPGARRIAALAGAGMLAVAAVVFGLTRLPGLRGESTGLDANRIAVLPFTTTGQAGTAAPPGPDQGAIAAERVRLALGEWRDVRLVDSRRIGEAVESNRGSPMRRTEALRVARSVGAGRMVWGDVSTTGDSSKVRAVLYDVATGEELRSSEMHVGPGMSGGRQPVRALTNGLLREGPELPWTGEDDDRPASLAAWREYDRGRDAMARWQLDSAEAAFAKAVAIDPGLALAQLGLTEVITWNREPTRADLLAQRLAMRREAAREALRLGDHLPSRDDHLAAAYLALADQRYPDACAHFDSALAVDAASFAAMIGRGDCAAWDDAVLADARAPGGWRFRSSHERAARAYERALELLAPPHPDFAYLRLAALLPIESHRIRFGAARRGADTLRFAAYPFLARDTIAHIPVAIERIAAAGLDGVPRSHLPALEANRDRLLRAFARWIRASPASARAHESFAVILESAGDLTGQPPAVSALSEIRVARGLTIEALGRARQTQAEVRVLLKAGRFAEAKTLADSLLGANPDPPLDLADLLVGPAVLTGRLARASTMLETMSSGPKYVVVDHRGRRIAAPPAVLRERAAVLGAASLGVCDDRVRGFADRIDRVLASHRPDSVERAREKAALLARPLTLAAPCLGDSIVLRLSGTSPAGDRIGAMEVLLARRDLAALRAHFDTLRMARRFQRPGDIAFDHLYLESWMLAVSGDTSGAIRRLDLALESPETWSVRLLADVAQAGGLLRAMLLRAELAEGTDDRSSARKWARVITVLWADADPVLQPVVQRLRNS